MNLFKQLLLIVLFNCTYPFCGIWLYRYAVPVICPIGFYEASICFASWFELFEESFICVFFVVFVLANYALVSQVLLPKTMKIFVRVLLLLHVILLVYLFSVNQLVFINSVLAVFVTLLFKGYSLEKNIKE